MESKYIMVSQHITVPVPIINIQICYILATKICSGIRFSDTGSETFFRYSIFPILVLKLFSGTTFSQYRFRDFFSGSNLFQYLKKNEKFPVPGIPGTGTSHSCSRLTGQFLWFHCVLSIATVRSDLILKLPTKSSSQDKPEAQKKILKWYRLCPTHIISKDQRIWDRQSESCNLIGIQ